ncbi:MAG: ergothioneine biosynthesis protein EgtB [Acidimicrobiia bacterium]|nr:ergothioneine biosynthesis protein EgtB [Acidimicrobiia bacterium]
MKPATVHDLDAARARTLALVAALSDPQLTAQHSPLMSPIVWDVAHIAHFEELWLLRELGGAAPTDPRFDDVYDAFRHPRAERPDLDILDPEHAAAFAASVRARVLAAPQTAAIADFTAALLADDFVYSMVVRHEHQHVETMLATIQLMATGHPADAGDGPGRAAITGDLDGEVLVPAGPFVMGTDTDVAAYDNERPAHAVDLPAFFIDRTPTTNGEYLRFIEAGGYEDPGLWSAAGWAWRRTADLRHPEFWHETDDGWSRTRFGRAEPVPPAEPVQHIGWYEADAYARWAGKRLPSEAEWEKAASWNPGRGIGEKRTWPWGTDGPESPPAALWGTTARWGPDAVGAYPDGASAGGVLDLIGGVWEWTASDFHPYPGFRSFPYPEYSEVFFGSEYKVLRGGSWATSPQAISTTFRNWDHPIRRQIFSGVRCARDA